MSISEVAFSGKILAGRLNSFHENRAYPIFDSGVIDFFDECARKLRKSENVSEFKDLLTFAFFCRGSALRQSVGAYECSTDRLGWGLSVHVAPANVPVNLAYTLLFGLLSGNKCLVRASSKNFRQLNVFYEILKSIGNEEKFAEIYDRFCIIDCDYDDPNWLALVRDADVRIVWGGDKTVTKIRQIPSQPKAVELVFPDRQSLCVLNADAIAALSEAQLHQLAIKFYNDTLLLDQSACSSPLQILWLESNSNEAQIARFWECVAWAEKELGAIGVKKYIDKLTRVGRKSDQLADLRIREYGLGVTVANGIANTMEDIRLGFYIEKKIESIQSIFDSVSNKTQTLTYFGVDPQDIKSCLMRLGCKGIDRVVPVGMALDIGFYWDGKDILRILSRRIAIS